MKRIFLFLVLLTPFIVKAQTGVYALSFLDADSQAVNMSSFAGKKIIVVTVDAAGPDTLQLQSLDSLYQSRPDSLVIIAVPVTDCGGEEDVPLSNQTLKTLLADQLGSGYLLAAQTKGKKSAGEDQHPLLDWLTHVGGNSHFDRDVEETGQLFVINESGRLYGILKKKIRPTGELMSHVITRQFDN